MTPEQAMEILRDEWTKSVGNSLYQNPKKLDLEQALYIGMEALKREIHAAAEPEPCEPEDLTTMSEIKSRAF